MNIFEQIDAALRGSDPAAIALRAVIETRFTVSPAPRSWKTYPFLTWQNTGNDPLDTHDTLASIQYKEMQFTAWAKRPGLAEDVVNLVDTFLAATFSNLVAATGAAGSVYDAESEVHGAARIYRFFTSS